MLGIEFLDAVKRCPDYCIGLNHSEFGYVGHACWSGKAPCKLFQGLPCVPFARMNPSLFHAISEPTEPDPAGKTCECGNIFTPRCNRQAYCAECSTKRRKAKLKTNLQRFRMKSLKNKGTL